jgi:hypothetical protein
VVDLRSLREARRAHQRSAAQEYGAYLRHRTPEEAENDRLLIEISNDIALDDSRW